MMLGFQMLFWPQPKVRHGHVHNNLIFCPHTEIVWFVYGTAGHLYSIVSVDVALWYYFWRMSYLAYILSGLGYSSPK